MLYFPENTKKSWCFQREYMMRNGNIDEKCVKEFWAYLQNFLHF